MRRLGLSGLAALTLTAMAVGTAHAGEAQRGLPEEAAIHLQRARGFIAEGDRTRALAEQTQAIGIAPGAEPYKDRAMTWSLIGQCELAVADFDRAISFNPRDVDLYIGRAACYRTLGKPKQAREDLTLALRFGQRRAEAFALRAHVNLAEGDINGALTDLRWASDHEPRDVTLMSTLGIARFAAGDFDIAANTLQRSLRFRDDMRAMLYLYLAQSRSGMDARKDLRKHVAYLKSQAWPYPLIALYLGQVSPRFALTHAKSETDLCMGHYFVGQWHFVNGERSEAVSFLKKAVHTCPKNVIEYEAARSELIRSGKF